jgi:hypothetical protein
MPQTLVSYLPIFLLGFSFFVVATYFGLGFGGFVIVKQKEEEDMITLWRWIVKVMLFAALLASTSLRAYDDETSLLIPVNQGDKYGYIDAAGKVVIGFQFDVATAFHEGLAEVELGNKCGYIDRSGKLVIPYQRCYLFDDFQGGFAVVSFKKRGKERFMDPRGKLLHGAAFAFADSFSEGLAAVKPRREGKCCWGYIGKDGRFVIPPKFEDFAGRFSEGVA